MSTSLHKYIDSRDDVREHDMNTCFCGEKLCYLA